ncbi:MAG: hypothetical protein SFZ03_05895 [Candidatus Melainabacteria bacterium]|nr:hypothetical protein [Candidatus Melainabacteria bacterium]
MEPCGLKMAAPALEMNTEARKAEKPAAMDAGVTQIKPKVKHEGSLSVEA